jgi:SAM-dependent methyltransferase
MSSGGAELRVGAAASLRARLEEYYRRYYADALGIPEWRDLVALRLSDTAYEAGRLARLETALGRPVAGSRVLNVGCGTGGFDVLATRAGAEAWGVDASYEAVALAHLRLSRARVLCAAAEALPFRDRSFDVVYCYSTLEHVADAARSISEMIRVLKSDGRLYVHTPHRWACFEGHYKVFWLPGLPRPLSATYLALRGRPTSFLRTLRLLTLAECRSLVAAAGGRITRVLDDGARRPVGGPLWPLVRVYYRLFGIRPYVEFVATRGESA